MFDISRMNSDRVLEKLVQFFKNRTWLRKTSFKVETTWWWSRALETLSAKPENDIHSLRRKSSLKFEVWTQLSGNGNGLWSLNTVEWKHCQRPNGPEGWILLTKVTSFVIKVLTQILNKFHHQNIDQASTSNLNQTSGSSVLGSKNPRIQQS